MSVLKLKDIYSDDTIIEINDKLLSFIQNAFIANKTIILDFEGVVLTNFFFKVLEELIGTYDHKFVKSKIMLNNVNKLYKKRLKPMFFK